MKSISYIIPHYNNFERINILIDSITLKNSDEIIIIDDCSTDGSFELLSKRKKNIKLLRNDENSGAGKSRNLGLKHAKNEWIIFSDSDDYFTKGYREYIELYLNSSKEVIFFKPISEKLSDNNSVIGNRHGFYTYLIEKYLKEPTDSNLNNLKYKMVVPWSKLLSKSFLSDNSIFFDEVSISNDIMFSTKVGYFAKKVGVSNKTIYCCTESDASLTADVSYEKTLFRMSIFATQYKFLKEKLSEKELRRMGITGFNILVLALKNRYSLSEFLGLVKFFKDNKIPLFSPTYFFMRIKRFLKI